METLNTSQPDPKVPMRKHPARKDLARLLVLHDRLPWFCFFFTLTVLLLSAIDRYHLVAQFKQRERVVILDPAGTYYLSSLLQFSEAKEMHIQQAELAALVFLERNPKDFDNPDLLKLVFLKSAFNKAQDERISEAVEFRSKQLHQKVEIGRIDILATRDNEVLVAVTGQIIRSGIFQDRAFTEAFPFTLRLRLIRNPNMALNGRFPTAVGDFKYEINH
jgi:ribosomal protein L18E